MSDKINDLQKVGSQASGKDNLSAIVKSVINLLQSGLRKHEV